MKFMPFRITCTACGKKIAPSENGNPAFNKFPIATVGLDYDTGNICIFGRCPNCKANIQANLLLVEVMTALPLDMQNRILQGMWLCMALDEDRLN